MRELTDNQRGVLQGVIENWTPRPLSAGPHVLTSHGAKDLFFGMVVRSLEREESEKQLADAIHEHFDSSGVTLEKDEADALARQLHEVLSNRPDCEHYDWESVHIRSAEIIHDRGPARTEERRRYWCRHRHSRVTLEYARGAVGEDLRCGGVRAACEIPAEKRGMLPPRR